MSSGNPTSRTGVRAHGSSCLRDFSAQPSHLGRRHKACAPAKGPRKSGSCVITGGGAPPKSETQQ